MRCLKNTRLRSRLLQRIRSRWDCFPCPLTLPPSTSPSESVSVPGSQPAKAAHSHQAAYALRLPFRDWLWAALQVYQSTPRVWLFCHRVAQFDRGCRYHRCRSRSCRWRPGHIVGCAVGVIAFDVGEIEQHLVVRIAEVPDLLVASIEVPVGRRSHPGGPSCRRRSPSESPLPTGSSD